MEAATPTEITSLSTLNDTTTDQEYEQEELPLESRTPLVDGGEVGAVTTLDENDEGASAAATPTAITSLNDDDTTTQEYEQEEPSETETSLADEGEVEMFFKFNEDVNVTMARRLPKYVIIQSNHNHTYLRYNGENPDIPNAVEFDGDYSFSLETRFEVVRATTGTGLVHIKSLRNNKFLAHFHTANNRQFVTAMAAKPEENQSDRNCTLFRPELVGYNNNNLVGRLQHVNTGRFLRRFYGVSGTHLGLGALTLLPKQNPNDKTDEFTFIDWESVVVLPDRIRIKGDNGNYFCARGDGFMDFNHKPDNSGHFDFDVLPSRNGGVRLKSVFYNQLYWRDMSDSVWVLLKKPSSSIHTINTVFIPQMRGDKRIVMRSLRNNMFCKRFTGYHKTSCLASNTSFVDPTSYMVIEEPVHSRTINNVRYHLADAGIYIDGTPELKTDGSNNRYQNPGNAVLDIKRTFTNEAKWSSSTGWKAGFKMTFQKGKLDVNSYGLEISAEVSGEYEWGETETETLELGTIRTVTVPPESRVEMSLIGIIAHIMKQCRLRHDAVQDKELVFFSHVCLTRSYLHTYDSVVCQLSLAVNTVY